MLRSRASRLFTASMLVIGVMVLVNLVALIEVRAAGNRLHTDTTPRLLAAERVQFDAADMKGAQNLYLLDKGRSRPVFLADQRRLGVSIAAARSIDTSAADMRLLAQVSSAYRRFQALDATIWSELEQGDTSAARRLAAGPATTLYNRLSALSAALVRSGERERDSALSSLNRTQSLAIAVLFVLDAAALALVGTALAEWRRTRRRLDAANVTHEALVERMPLVLYRDSADGSQPLYVSPGVRTILGCDPAEWRNLPVVEWWRAHVHPDDLPRLLEIAEIDGDKVTARTFAIRLRVRRKGGGYRWVDVQEALVDDGDGRPAWRQGIIRDVHDEVIAERRYEDLVTRMPATLTIWNREAGTLLFVSAQFEQLTGEPAAAWVGDGALRRWEERVHPEDLADPARWRLPDDPLPSLYRWRRADGRYIWIREKIALEPEAEHGIIAVMSDATHEVEAERELADQRRRFELLIDQLPVVTYVSNPDGLITYVSPQVEKLLGYTQAEYLELGTAANRASTLVAPEDAARALDAMTLIREGVITEVDESVRMLTKDGEIRYTQLIARALHDSSGAVSEVQGVIVDLTALREAQNRSRDVTAALVNAAEAEQARIATELHDDTVQVMAALLMQLRLSMRDAPKLARFEQILAEALDRTRRLMFEIRPQILEAEGIGSALTAVSREGPWADGEGAYVDVRIGRQSATTEAIAYRAVRELVLNARKHSRATRFEITGRERNGKLVLEVADNGVGFDRDAALDRKRMALHLGLDATMERLRLAGGDLAIDTAPGAGARFTVTLPADPAPTPVRPDESELVAPG